MGETRKVRWWSVGALVALVVLVGVCVVMSLRRHEVGDSDTHKYRDFNEFYCAADELAKGHGAKEVFAAGNLGYVYPPLLAAVLTWLVPLGLRGAAVAWTYANAAELLAAAALSGWMAARLFRWGVKDGWRAWVWPLALGGFLLVMDKALSDMKMQQSNDLMLLCWTVAGVCVVMDGGAHEHRPAEPPRARAGRWHVWLPVLAGLAIGLGFNVKYLTVAAVPYLLVRGAWRAAAWGLVWCVVFAVAPALIIGWERNADLWRGGVDGLLHARGNEKVTAEGMARVMPLQTFGFSITTAMAQAGVALGSAKLGLTMAAGVGGGVLALMWAMYRRAGVSLVMWRGLAKGAAWDERARRLLAMEWAGLVVGVLAFSPQTNARHVAMALVSTTMMVGVTVMLWSGGGRARRLAAAAGAGMLIFWLGLVLPVAVDGDHTSVDFWHRIGGPCWCMVVGWLVVLWAQLEGEWGKGEKEESESESESEREEQPH